VADTGVVGLRHGLVVALTATAFSAGCSHQSSNDRDKARSEIRLARSFAAESATFVEFVLHGQATQLYAEEHARLLKKAVEQAAAEDSVDTCRTQLDLLSRALSTVGEAVRDPTALVNTRAEILRIRQALDAAERSL
jgi:hypothetical protein